MQQGQRKLWALVDAKTGELIDTGAPFDAETHNEAMAEAGGPEVLLEAGWRMVPLTPELERQYKEID